MDEEVTKMDTTTPRKKYWRSDKEAWIQEARDRYTDVYGLPWDEAVGRAVADWEWYVKQGLPNRNQPGA
jgi:hypothetical protein